MQVESDMNLSGRTIVITGGTSGIGLELARALLPRAKRVIVCGRNREKLARAAAALPGIEAHQCDVASEKDLREFATLIERDVPGLDVLINNAGIMRFFNVTSERDPEPIEREIATNLLAPMKLTELLLPVLMKQKEAAVVNVSSGLAYAQIAAAPVYCATKAALHSWSRSLRLQLESTSVRVFEMLPPRVESELGEGSALTNADRGRQMPADEYAHRAIAGIEAGRFEINAGGTKWLDLATRLARAPIERLMWRATKKLLPQ